MYNPKERGAFLDGRNDPNLFIPVLKRRLKDVRFKGKHKDYAEKLAQLILYKKALKIILEGEK